MTDLNNDLELIPVYQLWTKYGVNKSTFYRRLSDLDITPFKRGKRSYITRLEQDRLNRYHEHLVNEGGTNKSFEQPIVLKSSFIEPAIDFEDTGDILVLIEAISRHFASARSGDPIANQKALIYVAENKIILATSKVRELIGVKPKGSYQWGSFAFDRCGKIGRESGWKVRKVN